MLKPSSSRFSRTPRRTPQFRLTPCALALWPVMLGVWSQAAQAQAQAVPPVAAAASAPAATPSANAGQSIVVTGKRSMKLRDIPDSVTAVTGEQLQAQGAQSLADYIQEQPGVVFNSYQVGISNVVVRGIATSSGNVQGQATTGFFLNEVPLTEPGWSIVVPDIDTFDLNRVEVYRGPQGTLFGSASMGGAVQYVTNEADPRHFDAAVEGTASQTHHADVGGSAKGMINVPIQPGVLGIRAVAEYRKDPGYLDNIGLQKDGSNTTTQKGGRISAVLTPVDGTRLSWLSLWQATDSDDASYRLQSLGGLKRSSQVPEFVNTKINLNSLRWDQDLGWSKLTAIAGYVHKWQSWQFDYTNERDYYNSALGLNLTQPLYVLEGGDSDSSSLEVRLASKPNNGPFDWLIGAMTYNTTKHLSESLGTEGAAAAFDASTTYGAGSGAIIAPGGNIFNAYLDRVQGGERAVFGEGSYALAPRWKLTLGGRYFQTRQDQSEISEGFSTYPESSALSKADSQREHGFNPKVSVSYTPSNDLMVYALGSEGFRFGTPNFGGLSAYAIPNGSKSDTLRNYEVGTRSTLDGGKLQLDATLFYIDWRNIQLRAQTPDGYAYATNGGRAHSVGLEVSSRWRPSEHWDYTTSLTYQQARLDDDVYILYYGTAPKGSSLPGTADFSLTQRLNYYFGGVYPQMVSLSHQYLSRGFSDISSQVDGQTPLRQGGYSLFDVRYRISVDNTDISLFVNNLFDRRGITRTVAEDTGTAEGLVRPRTVGVTVAWHY